MLKKNLIYKNYYRVIFLTLVLLPILTFAQNKTPKTISEIFYDFAIGNLAGWIPTLIMIAFVTFLSGVVMYARAGENEEMRAKGRSIMVYGIVVLFFMSTIWGFVRIVTQSFFGTDPEITNYLPPLL